MPYINKTYESLANPDKEIRDLKKQLTKLVEKFYKARFAKRTHRLGEDYIETAGKFVGVSELVNGVDAVLDGWWTDGRYSEEFCRALRRYLGIKLAFLTNSGSSANLVAFLSLTSQTLGGRRLVTGDEVISVGAAFPTTVNPIVQAGCVPVFVDINLDTLNINPQMLKRALSPKTKAIMIAHTQGNPFPVGEVVRFARKHKLWLVEDSCDALGAEYAGQKVGTFGDIATFSFYPAHQMTMGEGGAVVTNNPILFRAARSYRDWGRDCWCETGEDNACRRRFSWQFGKMPSGYDHKFIYTHMGYNLKLTDMQAAIGLAQIKRLPGFVTSRRTNYTYLKKHLSKFKTYLLFQEPEKNSKPSWFGFMITLKLNCPFKLHEIVNYLNDHKIATRPLYCGNIVRQPYFENLRYRVIGELKNTDYVMEHTFWIGVHPNLTKEHLDYMVEIIRKFVDEKTHE